MDQEPIATPLPGNASLSTGWRQHLRRRWVHWGVGLLVVVAAGGGWVALRAGSSAASEPSKQPDKPIELAGTDLVQVGARALGRIVSVSGSINPVVAATVKSKLAAEVAQIHVQEGEAVHTGQLLATLETADIRARLDAQQAAVAESQAKLDLALKNQANNRQLLSQSFISQNAYDTAQNGVDVAQASVAAAKAQADIARRALTDTQVRAPFSGVVAKRMVNAGEKVSPDVPLFQLVDLARMEMQAQVPVADIPFLKLGQALELTVDGFEGRRFSGTVGRINPTTEVGTRAISIFVALSNGDGALRGGMFAKGQIAVQTERTVNALPLSAIHEEAGQSFVFVIKNGQLERSPVQLGLNREDLGLVELRDGPSPGSEVVAVKSDKLKVGAKVQVRRAAT